MLDGVYCIKNGVPVFHAVRAPSAEQLQTLLNQLIKRIMKLLTRQGYLVEEQDRMFMAETNTDLAMAPLQSAACTYRVALGPRAGQKVLSLHTVPTQAPLGTKQRCVNAHGFSLRLHAQLRCAMNQRNELECLCRYITRPAIANERLTRNQSGDVVLELMPPNFSAPVKDDSTV